MAGERQVMSMLPMDFSSVLDSFSQPVLVTDTTGAHVNGVWVEDGPGTTRTVSAIVLAMSRNSSSTPRGTVPPRASP